MQRQSKISKSIGRDTHVRDQFRNKFKPQAHGSYSMITGEIEFAQPEPIFKQNFVTVKFSRGGRVSTVGYPGAFIDPISGNFHGVYEGPIPGQMVMVGFENGNSSAPFVVNRYPYQGVGDSTSEFKYITPMTKAKYDATDVIIGHFAGSFLRMNTGILSGKVPGSMDIFSMSDLNIESNINTVVKSGLSLKFETGLGGEVTITDGIVQKSSLGGEITITDEILSKTALGGEINVGALLSLKNSAFSVKELIDSLITTLQGAYTIPVVPGNSATFDLAFIALLEAEKAKWALLLE